MIQYLIWSGFLLKSIYASDAQRIAVGLAHEHMSLRVPEHMFIFNVHCRCCCALSTSMCFCGMLDSLQLFHAHQCS
jgi:hypothetical protein